jgi:ribosomal subunit interface protein
MLFMHIHTKATNIELTPAISEYIDKKFSAFERLLKGDVENSRCDVEVGKTTNHHRGGDIFKAEVNLHVPGQPAFFAVSEKSDLYAAIDDVKDEIVSALSSHKDKTETRMRKGALKIKQMLKGFDWRTWKQ